MFPIEDRRHKPGSAVQPLTPGKIVGPQSENGYLQSENLALALFNNEHLLADSPIEIFTILPIAGIGKLEPEKQNLSLESIKAIKKKKSVRGSMFGSIDVNQIITPPNFGDRRFKEFNRYAAGYSTGFTLAFGRGRWEMETGMIYSAKYYNPPTVLFIAGGNIRDGYLVEGLKYFELDVYNIPLNFRYNYVNRGKWRAYAMVGASLQIAGQTPILQRYPGWIQQSSQPGAYPGTWPGIQFYYSEKAGF